MAGHLARSSRKNMLRLPAKHRWSGLITAGLDRLWILPAPT